MRIAFHVKKWLEPEKFAELVEIADYAGRDKVLGSKFVLNISKIVENGYTFERVKEILEDSGIYLGDSELNYLKSQLSTSYKVTLEWLGNDVVLKSKLHILKFIPEAREYLLYNRRLKAFKIKPYKFFEVKRLLESRGLIVSDATGLQESLKTPFKISFRGELRDYQGEALNSWISRGMKGIIALPTGSGKTIIAIKALSELQEKALIVTYTKEQMFQWADMILSFTNIPRSYVGFYYGDEKKILPIVISTYQTAFRHIKKIARFFSLLIIDEVHHLPAEKFRYIAVNSFSTKRMGLSATVVREDGRHEELFPLMGGVVFYKAPSELSVEGYLAPYRIIPVYVDLDLEELKAYRETLEVYKNIASGFKFRELIEKAKRGDRRAIQALKVHSRLRQIVHKARGKFKAVKDIVSRELLRGSKIIIFTQYVDQAVELGELLGAPVLTGETDKKERRRALEEFKRGNKRVLVVTTVGDEGLDIPDVNVGVIVTGTSSRRQFVQRLGRLLRPKPGKEARMYEIIVRGTSEEVVSRKRKKLSLDDLVRAGLVEDQRLFDEDLTRYIEE